MPDDIFDLGDTSDLPEGFFQPRKAYRRPPPRHSKYIDLIAKAGRPVTTRELRVAFYRDYGEVRSNERIWRGLYALIKSGRVRHVSRGVYALPDVATDGDPDEGLPSHEDVRGILKPASKE